MIDRDTSELDDNPGPATSVARKPVPVRRKMSLALVNFWLNAFLLVTITFYGWVSTLLRLVFPAPTLAAGWELWGLSYNQWHETQFYSLCVFALLVLVHVMLHWNWVCSVFAAQVLRLRSRPDGGMQTIYGVATLIMLFTIILGALIAALLTVKAPTA